VSGPLNILKPVDPSRVNFPGGAWFWVVKGQRLTNQFGCGIKSGAN